MIDFSVSDQPVDAPKYITVDTFDYKVTYLPKQDSELSGDYCRHLMEIRLRRDVVPGYLRKTFTHELLHLLWDAAGLADDTSLGATEEERKNIEEKIVEALSARLLPVLRDNIEMVRWLVG